jgi:glycosyltransferase involved in cell wall biosynthesis
MIDEHTPLVSAVIPTRNRPEMLVRAVKSVTSQTYPKIEIIIVDDGSEYDVEAMIRKEIQSEFCRVIKNIRAPGAAGARNSGFYESRGEFIGFLDDDDEWMPKKIAKQIDAFRMSDNAVGIVITAYFVVQNGAKILRERDLNGKVFGTLCRQHLAGNTSNPLIRRKVFEQVGLFDEQMAAAQDTDLWLRIAKHYDFATVSEPLALIHWQASDRMTQNYRKRVQGMYRLLRKHWADLHPGRKYKLFKRIVYLTVAALSKSFVRPRN